MPDAAPEITPESPVPDLWAGAGPGSTTQIASRARTCLRRDGIATVGGLTGSTPLDITDIELAGPDVLEEVRRVLAFHGLSLRDDDGATPGDIAARTRKLMRAGLWKPVALRFARESWPKGEIAPGIMLEVAE